MELKQWLYNHGDLCLHNTGGWMKCLVKGTPYTKSDSGYSSTGKVESEVLFSGKNVVFKGRIQAPLTWVQKYVGVWVRGGGLSETYIGTIKPMPSLISKYNSLIISTDDADITQSIRVGNANDDSTSTSTATILQSGSGNMEIVLGEEYPYFVIGCRKEKLTADGNKTPGTDLDYSYSCSMDELYLV